MKVPFVSFLPLEEELKNELHAAFERVLKNSWYIDGKEDRAFEEAFAAYCDCRYCIGVGNGLDALMLILKLYRLFYHLNTHQAYLHLRCLRGCSSFPLRNGYVRHIRCSYQARK